MIKRVLLGLFLLLVACPVMAQHYTTLSWTASASTCPIGVTCTITYNVFRGTATGAESTTPLNSSPIAGTTYNDTTVVLGNTYYYVVQGVETVSSTLTLTSASSNEVSVSFPLAPSAPTTLVGAPH